MLADGLFAQGLLTDTAAMAAVALVAYLFLRRERRPPGAYADAQLADALARAGQIAATMAQASANVRGDAAALARSIAAFQAQLAAMQTGAVKADWHKLRDQADRVLGPALTLVTSLTLACDQLRRQHVQLITFSASRIDPATGLHNRRSLDEQLTAFFSIHATGNRRFSLAMFSVCPAGVDAPETSEERLRLVARLLQECIRDDDFVARYSYDEFVVLMPQTALAGALAFGERLLLRAAVDLGCPMWGGGVEAASDEAPAKLLSRADSALYSARAAGRASLYYHAGAAVRRHPVDLEPAAVDAGLQDELATVG